ncbi:MAG: thioredoxin domain-containing protein [Chloroflexi bacterium]|nr:thioredoxin domain-containing protein [Chloroflexota bacterium]
MDELVEKYPDTVQIIYRHFPLTSIHPNAQKSSEAAEAAGAQGAFWEYHDLLFETQREWSGLDANAVQSFFVGLAEQLDLDTAQFAADLDGGVYAEYVSALEQESLNIGLRGTPSAIFNGDMMSGDSMPPGTFWIWDALVQLDQLEDRQYTAPPAVEIDVEKSYTAVVTMESGDSFSMELYPQSAPETVNNFVFLARAGWFDGVTFHRVLPGFVAQTGDPTGTGIGGPGYFIPSEIDPNLSHSEAGMVAMANSGQDQNGSQWYVTLGDVSQLDGGYSIFGRIIEGMDVVQAITPRDPSQNPDIPAGDRIVSVTIVEE